MPKRDKPFFELVREAIADVLAHGFDSETRIQYWLGRLRAAAESALPPLSEMAVDLRNRLESIFRVKVENGGIIKLHPGIPRFTLERVKPRLRAELDRRIMASANLIKLNRQSAVEDTLKRFSGWSTSIPPGGSDVADKTKAGEDLRKDVRNMGFVARRVATDQGHKFIGNLSDILATDGGAIAARWHSNWQQANYNYRHNHKARDGAIYVVRDNPVIKAGLMKKDGHLYTDEITQPGEEVFCRCHYEYIYLLTDLPPEMLTAKGAATITQAREMLNA